MGDVVRINDWELVAMALRAQPEPPPASVRIDDYEWVLGECRPAPPPSETFARYDSWPTPGEPVSFDRFDDLSDDELWAIYRDQRHNINSRAVAMNELKMRGYKIGPPRDDGLDQLGIGHEFPDCDRRHYRCWREPGSLRNAG